MNCANSAKCISDVAKKRKPEVAVAVAVACYW